MIGKVKGAFITLSASMLAPPAVAQSMSVGVPAANLGTLGWTAGSIFALGALGALFSTKLQRLYLPSVEDFNLAEEIPFIRIDEDGETVICEDGVTCRVLEVSGVNYASLDREQTEQLYAARRYLLKNLDEMGGVQIIVFSERAKMPVRIAEGGTNEWLSEVNRVWASEFKQSFVNRHNIVVVDMEGGKLDDACQAVVNNLDSFGVRTMRHNRNGASPLWAFLYRYVKGLGGPGWHGPGDDLPAELGEGSLFFDEATGLVEASDGERRRFWKTVTVSHLGDEVEARLMRQLGNIDREVIAVHRIMPKGLVKSAAEIRKKKKNSFMFFVNTQQKEEFDAAETALFNHAEGYADYELSFFVYGDTAEAANAAAVEVKALLTKYRAAGVSETRFCEEAHWDRFPRKNPVWLRHHMPRLSDIAELMPFEGTPRGLDKCWWGRAPLRTMRTVAGVPYSVGVHEHDREEALGNAAFIGKPGSGKTTMAQWLITGALSQFPNLRAFCFDNLDGMTVGTTAFGGRLVRPGQPGEESFTLAPLQIADTGENREFLVPFLLELAKCDETPANMKAVSDGLDMLMNQDKANRTLSRYVAECLPSNTDVKTGLQAWVDGGAYSGWFDGKSDALDLSEARWTTFDMQRVIESPRVASALVSYILHRIRTEVWSTPTPHIIFIDEAATLADASPVFVKLVKYLARNIRKKMGSVWLAFQEPGGMGEMSEVVRNATATMFYWRDPSANDDDYRWLNLTPADMRFIRDEDDQLRHLRRAVLAVRKHEQGRESVVIDGDLSSLGKYLQLYRAGSDAADTMAAKRREYGEEKCVGPYLAEMESLQQR